MCCQHDVASLKNKSLRFSQKEKNRTGGTIIGELDLVEENGETIAKCRHGDKNQIWRVNEDFTTTKLCDSLAL
jgi:hypothetical protein